MPLEPLEIKSRIMRNGDTINGLADKWGFWPADLSKVINRRRGFVLLPIRKKLAQYLKVPVSEVGCEPTVRKRAA